MFRYFLLNILLCTPIYGGVLPKLPNDWMKNERIFGGIDIDIEEAPYQAAILYGVSTFTQFTAGAIISPNMIATVAFSNSAHPGYYRVRVGSTYHDVGGQILSVSEFIYHPLYDRDTVDYNIALAVLSSDIIFDGVTTAIIPLPVQDVVIPDFTFGIVTGWGYYGFENNQEVYARILQKIIQPIINFDECVNILASSEITQRMICAGNIKTGGESPCLRDHGTPMVVDGTLIGLYSFGYCYIEVPSVYTRVAAVTNWIKEEITNSKHLVQS